MYQSDDDSAPRRLLSLPERKDAETIFGVKLEEQPDGSINVYYIPAGGLLEKLLPAKWFGDQKTNGMNEVALVWYDCLDDEWKTYHVGPIGEASQRVYAYAQREGFREDEIIRLRSLPEKRIYLFFYDTCGVGTLSLCHPFVGTAFGELKTLWPVRLRVSYLEALNSDSPFPMTKVETPAAALSDLEKFKALFKDVGLRFTEKLGNFGLVAHPTTQVRLVIEADHGDVPVDTFLHFDEAGKYLGTSMWG